MAACRAAGVLPAGGVQLLACFSTNRLWCRGSWRAWCSQPTDHDATQASPSLATTAAAGSPADASDLFPPSPGPSHSPLDTLFSRLEEELRVPGPSHVAAGGTDPGPPGGPGLPDPPAPGQRSLPGLPPELAIPEGQSLAEMLLQPLPRTRKHVGSLGPLLHVIGGQQFLDPEAVLTSTVRALHVVREVLRRDLHVYVVNSNPMLRPLLKEAAASNLNSNVWFHTRHWVRGTLTNHACTRRLFQPSHQPSAQVLRAQGRRLANVHCPSPPPHRLPVTGFDNQDRWRMFEKSSQTSFQSALSIPGVAGGEMDTRTNLDVLEDLTRYEISGRLQALPSSLPGRLSRLGLLVVLDASTGFNALVEAEKMNVMTASVVTHERDMSYVTYPIYARGYHPRFQHFFLDWLLKVVNLPDPPLPDTSREPAGFNVFNAQRADVKVRDDGEGEDKDEDEHEDEDEDEEYEEEAKVQQVLSRR